MTVEDSPAGGGPAPNPAPGRTPRHGHARCREARRRVASDGVAGPQRPSTRPAGNPAARFEGHAVAELSAQLGRPYAGDATVTHCANDGIALGVLRAMHESNRSVPAEVSVVGFDDMPDSGYLVPPLTTVRQDFTELGRRGVALLLRQMQGADRARLTAAWSSHRNWWCGPAPRRLPDGDR
jgi:DNA-binding LacI/PurR family transcriptional regulator